jgi:hypothetical protein
MVISPEVIIIIGSKVCCSHSTSSSVSVREGVADQSSVGSTSSLRIGSISVSSESEGMISSTQGFSMPFARSYSVLSLSGDISFGGSIFFSSVSFGTSVFSGVVSWTGSASH